MKWPGFSGTATSSEVSSQSHGLVMAPHRQTKVIHFIRHAEGFHNVGFEQNHDAHLTPFGWQQAKSLREHIRSQRPPMNIEVVIVSPFMRTLETAVGVFGGAPVSEADTVGADGEDPQILMLSHDGQPDTRSPRPTVRVPEGLPFIACELCRERVGSNRCDSRRDVRETRAAFPGVDFSLIEEGEDSIWADNHQLQPSGGCYPSGEGEYEVMARGVAFVRWLMQRPEKNIAVVSHAGFLKHTLQAFRGVFKYKDAREFLGRTFLNCEMRTVVVTDRQQGLEEPHDPTYFPGGPIGGLMHSEFLVL